MKKKKTLSLDEEVIEKIGRYSREMHQTESSFVSMLVNEVDRVVASVTLQAKEGDAGAEDGI